MKVDLLDCTPLLTIVQAIRICYDSMEKSDNLGFKDKNLIRNIIKLGHESVIEHCIFTWKIEGISRVCSHQLVRHRIASYSQQSHRYTEVEEPVIPPSIANLKYENEELYGDVMANMEEAYYLYGKLLEAGIKKEDARYIIPQAVKTNLITTMNARSLRNFFKLRLHSKAQWEIRQLAENMFLKIPKEHRETLFYDINIVEG